MRNFLRLSVLMLLLGSAGSILADDSDAEKITREAAIGGGVGGALGGAIGAELSDRKGAIIGAAVGAAIGATMATEGGTMATEGGTIATDGGTTHAKTGHTANLKLHPEIVVVIPHVDADHHPKGRHCPPGQAKKGRC